MEKTEQNLNNIQQYVDFVKTNLEPLAQQLKVGVDFLWGVLVKQAQVEAIVYLIISISLALTTFFLTVMFFKFIKKATFGSDYHREYSVYKHKKTGKEISTPLDDWENREQYEKFSRERVQNRYGTLSIITGIGASIMLLVSIITSATNLPIIVTGLVNPEFRAIENIVNFAKPKVEEAKTKVEVETK